MLMVILSFQLTDFQLMGGNCFIYLDFSHSRTIFSFSLSIGHSMFLYVTLCNTCSRTYLFQQYKTTVSSYDSHLNLVAES
jgi:hypothetical protein